MGKPYDEELDRLTETYAWAMQAPVGDLADAVAGCAGLPLIGIGSGGSLTAADFACTLHQEHVRVPSTRVTPLEFASSLPIVGLNAVLVLSAGGSNPDILDCAERVVFREPTRCVFLCLRKGSPLSRVARRYSLVDLVEFSLPTIKDGFLATNALLAFCVLLTRAYGEAYSGGNPLPPQLSEVFPGVSTVNEFARAIANNSEPLWSRDTLFVLYGPSVRCAAIDLESKFTEAALGNVRIADFRNFAHGMHNWVQQRAASTALLVLASGNEKQLAEKTLSLIPPQIPRMTIASAEQGPAAVVGSLVGVLHLVGLAGRVRGLDPGRPKVPEFGRRIYRLRALGRRSVVSREELAPAAVAVSRKLRCLPALATSEAAVSHWTREYEDFITSLQSTVFRAIVLDYDGTLCDARDRYRGLRDPVSSELDRLVEGHVLVGVATGRGRSVRDNLRRVIRESFWAKIAVGYYNCADIGLLNDDSQPPAPGSPPSETLARLASEIAAHPVLSTLASIETRARQISIRPHRRAQSDSVLALLRLVVEGERDATLVVSSHSIDILESGVSKRRLIDYLRGMLGDAKTPVLAIGDRGGPQGNDYYLLKDVTGLSVDEISCDSKTCWNIAPVGHRGVQATLDYLTSLKVGDEGCYIDFRQLHGTRGQHL